MTHNSSIKRYNGGFIHLHITEDDASYGTLHLNIKER